jgi:HEAT repeat protein
MDTMSDLWSAHRGLEQQLENWQREAPAAVQTEIARLRDASIDARTDAAEALAAMGTDARGAALALIECWVWSPPRPERPDRLAMTRRASAIRKLRTVVDRALAAIGAPIVAPLVTLAEEADDGIPERSGLLSDVRDPAAVGPLVAALESIAVEVRAASAEALGAIGDAAAVDALGRALGDADATVRRRAGVALRLIGGQAGVERLIEGLRSDDEHVTAAAAELAEITDPDAVERLLAALRDEHDAVVVHACRALGRQKVLAARLRLTSLVASRSDAVSRAAADALDQIEPDWWQSRLGHSIVPTLLERLREAAASTRARAAMLLGRIGDNRAGGALVESLGDGDRDVRRAAAEALGRIGEDEGVEPLARALEAESTAVARRAMIASLGTLRDRRAVEPLIAALRLKREPDTVITAAWALVEIGDSRAVAPLVSVVNEAGYTVPAALAAVEALASLGDPDAIPGLRTAVASHWTDNTRAAGFVGRAAADAIRQLEAASLRGEDGTT